MPVENANPKDDADEGVEIVVEETGEGDNKADAKPNGAASEDTTGGASAEPNAESPSQPVAGGEEELEQYSESVKRRIAKLTGKMREAERREQAAIEYAKSLQKQQEEATKRVQTVEQYHLREWGERLKAQEVLLRGSLTRAIEMGDAAKQAEAQKALAELAMDQRSYQNIEAQRQNAARAPQQAPQPPAQQAPQQPPPMPDAKAQAWASRNTWFGQNEAMTVTAFAHHKRLVEQEGVDPTSDEYYAELDRRMREDFPLKFQQARTAPQAQPRPNTVAPAVRTVQQPSGKKTDVVRLSPSQVAIAKKLGVPLEQYARQVAKLNREG